MTIQVKFFASLREQVGQGEIEVDAGEVTCVSEVWTRTTNKMPMPENTLMAVNMEYVDAEHAVNEGDEVAFFPPVTGG